jgi:hypothetical protein
MSCLVTNRDRLVSVMIGHRHRLKVDNARCRNSKVLVRSCNSRRRTLDRLKAHPRALHRVVCLMRWCLGAVVAAVVNVRRKEAV